MAQMVATLNEQPNVTFEEVTAEDFYDYGDLFDRYYKKFPSGTIQKNHVFWVDCLNPTTMVTQISASSPAVPIHLLNNKNVPLGKPNNP